MVKGTLLRSLYVQQCKEKALQLVAQGDLAEAWHFLVAALAEYPPTRNDPHMAIGADMWARGELDTPVKLRAYIQSIY